MWDLPGPGLEPVSPALAGGFLTTVPPGKPSCIYLSNRQVNWLSTPEGNRTLAEVRRIIATEGPEPKGFPAPGYKLSPDNPTSSESVVPRRKASASPPPLPPSPIKLSSCTLNSTPTDIPWHLYRPLTKTPLCFILFSPLLKYSWNRFIYFFGIQYFVCLFVLAVPYGTWDHSSPARDRTLVPCSGSVESQPLDHQGSPIVLFIF